MPIFIDPPRAGGDPLVRIQMWQGQVEAIEASIARHLAEDRRRRTELIHMEKRLAQLRQRIAIEHGD